MTTYNIPNIVRFSNVTTNSFSGTHSNVFDKQVAQSILIPDLSPGWRDKILAHVDATKPYTRTGFSAYNSVHGHISDANIQLSGATTRSECDITWDCNMDSTFFVPFDSVVADNEAIGKLRGAINKSSRQFQSLIPLGEVHEIRSLIKGVASKAVALAAFYKDLKHGRAFKRISINARRNGRSVQREIASVASDYWLTWGFGVRPLLADTAALAESVAAYLNRNDHSLRFRSRSASSWHSAPSTVTTQGGDYSIIRAYPIFHYSVQYQYTAGHTFLIQSANNYAELSDQFGFRLEHIVPAIWEITAFSWIFDYFTTAGDFLSDTFVKPPGLTNYAARSRLCKIKVLANLNVEGSGSINHVIDSSLTPLDIQWFHFSRTVLGALPSRSLSFKSTAQVGSYAPTKIINLFAVLLK